ncbi:MAG: selenoneine biosynthesis selenosugar synthase SenB [Pirellulaceae bacterium]
MQILIVTPAPPRTQHGNRITALRWARILRGLGHKVRVLQAYEGQACDVLIAMHARRSASSVERFRTERPRDPLVLALTGTDLYRDMRTRRTAQRSAELASRLVLLQWHALGELPSHLAYKARVIYQSMQSPLRKLSPLKRVFETCVVGHLRPVKDPFRAALAVRRLPADSQIHVVHLGAAMSPAMDHRARAETQSNPRYEWLGELPLGKTRLRLGRARLLVHSSKLEGGANVLSEAVAAATPVLSSRIPGSKGILGEYYPGYFEVGDTSGLTKLLLRAERDKDFYQELKRHCQNRLPLIDPVREAKCWEDLLGEFQWEWCGAGTE